MAYIHSMVAMRVWLLFAEIQVVCNDICGEGYNGDAEARECVAQERCPGEDRVFSPCLCFGPWVSKKGLI